MSARAQSSHEQEALLPKPSSPTAATTGAAVAGGAGADADTSHATKYVLASQLWKCCMFLICFVFLTLVVDEPTRT